MVGQKPNELKKKIKVKKSFILMFDKISAYIAHTLGGNEESRSSKLSKDILNCLSRMEILRPQAGEWVK